MRNTENKIDFSRLMGFKQLIGVEVTPVGLRASRALTKIGGGEMVTSRALTKIGEVDQTITSGVPCKVGELAPLKFSAIHSKVSEMPPIT